MAELLITLRMDEDASVQIAEMIDDVLCHEGCVEDEDASGFATGSPVLRYMVDGREFLVTVVDVTGLQREVSA